MVEIAFACKECGEVLVSEVDGNGIIATEDSHSCIGENLGFMGKICRDEILLNEEYKIVFESEL